MRALRYVVLLSAFVVVSVSSLDGGLRKKRAIGGNHGSDYFGSQGSAKLSHQKGKSYLQKHGSSFTKEQIDVLWWKS